MSRLGKYVGVLNNKGSMWTGANADNKETMNFTVIVGFLIKTLTLFRHTKAELDVAFSHVTGLHNKIL